jgi:hypothetical protein
VQAYEAAEKTRRVAEARRAAQINMRGGVAPSRTTPQTIDETLRSKARENSTGSAASAFERGNQKPRGGARPSSGRPPRAMKNNQRKSDAMTEKTIAGLKADLAAAEVQFKKMKEACRVADHRLDVARYALTKAVEKNAARR